MFYVTSWRGIRFKRCVYFYLGRGSTRVLCSRQEACYINTFYTCFHECVCLCGCPSVNDTPLCASHRLLRFLALACPVHPLLPTTQPPSQTPVEACKSIICHWVMTDCTYKGTELFQKQGKPTYITASFCLWINMKKAWWYISSTGLNEYK